MQGILVGAASALLVYAGFAAARVSGSEQNVAIDAQPAPSIMQPVALGVAAVIALVVAALLGGRRGVRLPTPARLDELAGRAERVAVERAEAVATAARDGRDDPTEAERATLSE